jgi:hypothetical protein
MEQTSKTSWWRNKDIQSIALIVVTGFLALFTAWMAWETHKLSGDSAEQVKAAATSANATQKAAAATEKSATATERSASVSEKSITVAESSIAVVKRNATETEAIAKAELRPYIYVTDLKIEGVQVGKTPKTAWEIKNLGKTPGYNVNLLNWWKIGTDIYEQEALPLLDRAKKQEGYAVAPGMPLSGNEPFFRAWGSEDSVAITTRNKHLFFVCTITYQDQFGEDFYTQEGFVYLKGTNDLRGLRQHVKVK